MRHTFTERSTSSPTWVKAKDFGLQVTTRAKHWRVNLEGSVDGKTFTVLDSHESTKHQSGETVWINHKPVASIRLTLDSFVPVESCDLVACTVEL